MNGYIGDIETLTKENESFRKVLFTTKLSQLVLMTLQPGEDIGSEVHEGHDQFFRVDEGEGKVELGDETRDIKDGDAIVVPSGVRHNVINTGDAPLKFYTIYTPPEHRYDVEHTTKKQALSDDEHFDGQTN